MGNIRFVCHIHADLFRHRGYGLYDNASCVQYVECIDVSFVRFKEALKQRGFCGRLSCDEGWIGRI